MPIRPWYVKRALVYLCFLLLLLPPASRGLGETRDPGDCGCAPSLYTFRLNLSLDCDDTRIQNTEHVDSSRCVISHNVDKPKSVHSILVEETSFKGAETVSEEGSGFFEDGNTFSFRSNLLPPNDVAKELRMVLIGFNESGTTLITNEISIEFTNICGSTAVFQQGDSIGWIEILSSTNGPEYCIPTPLPSMGPTRRESPMCICSPTGYALELDFDLTCDDSYEKIPSTGVEGTFCFVASQTSEKPMEITDVTMIEVDEDFEVINQQIQQGRFGSGDVLEFETITLRNNSLSILPRAIQFSLSGINLEGDLIDQTWITQFTNDCDVNPVLMGVEIGWTRIVRTSPPNEVYCQAAAASVPLSEGSPTLTRSHSSQPTSSKCVKSGKDKSSKSMSPSSIRPEKSPRGRRRRRAVEEEHNASNSNRLLIRDGIIAPRTSLVVSKRGKGGGTGSEQPATCY